MRFLKKRSKGKYLKMKNRFYYIHEQIRYEQTGITGLFNLCYGINIINNIYIDRDRTYMYNSK